MDQEDKECVITALNSLQEAKAAIQLHIKGLWSCLSTTTPIKEERAEAVDSKLWGVPCSPCGTPAAVPLDLWRLNVRNHF